MNVFYDEYSKKDMKLLRINLFLNQMRNNKDDIDKLIDTLKENKDFFLELSNEIKNTNDRYERDKIINANLSIIFPYFLYNNSERNIKTVLKNTNFSISSHIFDEQNKLLFKRYFENKNKGYKYNDFIVDIISSFSKLFISLSFKNYMGLFKTFLDLDLSPIFDNKTIKIYKDRNDLFQLGIDSKMFFIIISRIDCEKYSDEITTLFYKFFNFIGCNTDTLIKKIFEENDVKFLNIDLLRQNEESKPYYKHAVMTLI